MNKKIQLSLIYLVTVVISNIVALCFFPKYPEISSLGFVMLFNIILFLIIIKCFNIPKHLILKLIILIEILFIPLIIDSNYFISSYIQSTPTTFFPESILALLATVLYPHTNIFYILFKLNISEISFIIIPCYFLCIYAIIKRIL